MEEISKNIINNTFHTDNIFIVTYIVHSYTLFQPSSKISPGVIHFTRFWYYLDFMGIRVKIPTSIYVPTTILFNKGYHNIYIIYYTYSDQILVPQFLLSEAVTVV